ncbi:MAG: cell division FtsZ family protein [Mycoplasmoidaceae bacterium]|nr:cell division FtsZ family protein [Mycoplasmoidaceae bacterium]
MYALNTDIAALRKIEGMSNLFVLGKKMLRGAGSGGDPMMGKTAAEQDAKIIEEELRGTDMLFLVAGLGKGTGSGATPVIAEIAKKLGILTIGIVNLPSVSAEGSGVYQNALHNLKELKRHVDSITTISNDLIIKNSDDGLSFIDAFDKANMQVCTIIGEITDIITKPAYMNVDFADIKNFFKKSTLFNANAFDLTAEYSKQALAERVQNCLDTSYTDIKLTNANNIIVNVQINKNTPAGLISDIRNVFKTLSNNNDLNVVAGVDYGEIEHIHMSFLVATNEEDAKLNASESIKDDPFSFNFFEDKNKQQKIQFESNTQVEAKPTYSQESIDQYRTNKTKACIQREKFSFDNEEESTKDESAELKLNSQECTKLITKALSGVINTTTIDESIEQKKQN